MTDERFEKIMREVAQAYNQPPVAPPYEEMWNVIERHLHSHVALIPSHVAPPGDHGATIPFPKRRPGSLPGWLKLAAMLILGAALGRLSPALQSNRGEVSVQSQNVAGAPAGYSGVTDRYLGETAALLIALPAELRSSTVDPAFNARADELLLQTRLLLDSPAAGDPALRTLFEDLEMVLVQLVRLQADRDSTHLELLNEALEQGNVIPRLRTAVVEHIGD